MKTKLLVLFAAAFTLSVTAENKFVGANTCVCHGMEKLGKQLAVWKTTKHADAFNVLKSDKAAEFATAKEIKGSPSEAPECLECHTTGYGKESEKTFKMDMGVQCEACHGAASAYKPIHNKPENKEKALAAGLIVAKDDETLCKTCHTPKMHDMKEFDFKKSWDVIKHPRPKA
jgi:Cytochrome c554 and c-prime